jgi:uracil-DNA glycosylase family 4
MTGASRSGLLLDLPSVATPIPEIDQLVADVVAGGPATICNFYAGAGGAARRRRRLSCYLHARWTAPIVLVGEAAGYRGACRSGIAFTSERQLTGSGFAESSATIVHRVLDELGVERQVLCWNAVPYHPHVAARHESNRPPTPLEVAACRGFLARVCGGRQVIAVGRVAAAAIGQVLDGEVPQVRHPAHGGARAFADGLAPLLATWLRPPSTKPTLQRGGAR